MDVETKKQRERRIFDMVYGDVPFAELADSECPDFLLRLFNGSPFFGVEITEFFHSETSARLHHISGYSHKLLDGADFKHKDDREALDVAKVDIIREDDSIHAKGVPAIIQSVPPPSECARQVAERIQSKSGQIRESAANMSHVNLIIQDKTGLLRLTQVQDFYRTYFVPELITALAVTSFREVFFVTELDDRELYVRLKMLLLLADAYLFSGALAANGIAASLAPDLDDVELFASYFASTVAQPVLVHREHDGTEVIFGDSGVKIAQDGSVTIRLHADRPIHPDARPPELQWQSLLGKEFHDTMTEFRKTNTFSTEAVFPITTTK